MTRQDTSPEDRGEYEVPWLTAWMIDGDLLGVICPVLMFLLIGFLAVKLYL